MTFPETIGSQAGAAFDLASTAAPAPQPFKRHGSPIRLGDELGYTMDPGRRWGRLVAIRHHPEREIHRYVIRAYCGDDQLGRPTGEYRTCAQWALQPYRPDP